MTPIKLALDWTPNTNHTGFFVAQALGFYAEANLGVTLIHPGQDDYRTTPAKKLELGEVDFAVTPSESVISLHTKAQPLAVTAVAAILDRDASAIVTLASGGVSRPAELDGSSYASYGARYEDPIVQEMIRRDGGRGDLTVTYPPKLGIWNTLINGDSDSTWIFRPWEGVEAEAAGVELNAFVPSDYGVPYGYSPVIIARSADLKREAYRSFIAATRRGFRYALEHPEDAVTHLKPHVPPADLAKLDLLKSQRAIGEYSADAAHWGEMTAQRWTAFTKWLQDRGLLTEALEPTTLFTNDLLTG